MLSPRKRQTAFLLAQGRLTVDEIAQEVGVSPRTIDTYKADPAVRGEVAKLLQESGEELKKFLLGHKNRRLLDLQRMYDVLWDTLRERARDPRVQGVAGGRHGVTVAEPWRVVSGKPDGDTPGKPKLIRRYRIDLALFQEMREIQKQAAIELGQWTENRNLSGHLKVDPLEFSPAAIALARSVTSDQLAAFEAELLRASAA